MVVGHRRVDGAELEGVDRDAARAEAGAQALEVGVERALGRAVGVVARATRSAATEERPPARLAPALEVVGQGDDQGDHGA